MLNKIRSVAYLAGVFQGVHERLHFNITSLERIRESSLRTFNKYISSHIHLPSPQLLDKGTGHVISSKLTDI